MRRPGVLLLVVLLALGGCANPSLESEARSLAAEVEALPGVQDVVLEYSEPVTLDSGKLQLTVAMADDATGAQVEKAGATVYEAFHEVHDGEEGDLELTFGDSRVHVRSFEPEAGTEAVARELALAVELADRGVVEMETNTQEVPRGDHVESTVLLRLGEGTGRDDVTRVLDELEAVHGGDDAQRSWGVAAADGSSLSLDPGFPDESARAGWEELNGADASLRGIGTAAVGLRELTRKGGGRYRFVEVAVVGAAGPLDLTDDVVRERVLALARAQVDLVSAPDAEAWSYDLAVDGERAASLDPTLCDPADTTDTGPLDADLRDEETCPGPTPEPSGS